MIDGKAAVIIASTLAGIVMCFIAVYGWGKWLNRPQRQAASATPDRQRLVSIEHAIEAIANEVERIGESQRFTAKLMTQRSEAERALPVVEQARAPGYRPMATPH
jgi:hypothetical protein